MGWFHPNPGSDPGGAAGQEASVRARALRDAGYSGDLDVNGYPCGPRSFRGGRAPTFRFGPGGAIDSALIFDAPFLAEVDGGWDGHEPGGYDHWDNR